MNLRLALYELSARYQLGDADARRLQQLAGLGEPPTRLAYWLPRGLAVLAAALGGFGVLLWIAANWVELGRAEQFALLQGVIVVMGGGILVRPANRVPLGLALLLGIGALFAFFGQTYQTGADPWQLFALWALLALPLCLALRSDVLWLPWTLLVFIALSLWLDVQVGDRWRVYADDLWPHLLALGAAAALATGFACLPPRLLGVVTWSQRTALASATAMITLTALGGLFQHGLAPLYLVGLSLLAGLAVLTARAAKLDVFGLSVVALGLNVLLVAGLGYLLLAGLHDGWIPVLFVVGLAALVLLTASVQYILQRVREQTAAEAA